MINSTKADHAGIPVYPLIRCEFTGKVRPGYAVCPHVIEGAEPYEIAVPKLHELGRMVCANCLEADSMFLPLWCADCAEKEFLPRMAQA